MGIVNKARWLKNRVGDFGRVLHRAVQPEIKFEGDKTCKQVIKDRVMRRYSKKCGDFNTGRNKGFNALFNLPSGVTFDTWLQIQLRGRGVETLRVLTLDHIVPLSQARDIAEVEILMSWKNTRLLDGDLNSQKSSLIDNESRLLCLALLGRYPDEDSIRQANLFKVKLHKARKKAKKAKRRR